MDIQTILQDEKKKKFIIIGSIVVFVIVGIFLLSSKGGGTTEPTQQDELTQLLTDLSQLSPRDSETQSSDRLVAPLIKVSADVPTVAPGQSSVISWNATNATSCVDGNGNALRTSGSLSITPTEDYTLDVVCTNPKGTNIESITVKVTTSPIITLVASPQEVLKGEQSFISWTTVNATRCVDETGKTLRLSGGMPVTPTKDYTFFISCSGPNGTTEDSITVHIGTSPIITIEDRTNTGTTGGSTTGSGTGTDTGTTGGSTTGSGTGTDTGSGSSTVVNPEEETITVGEGTIGPKITLTLSPNVVGRDETTKLSWEVLDADSCTLRTSGDAIILRDGKKFALAAGTTINMPSDIAMNESFDFQITGRNLNVTFTVSCNGSGMQATAKRTLYWDLDSAVITKAPSVTITADPTSIREDHVGDLSIVTWSGENATKCKVSADAYAELYNTTLGTWSKIYSNNPAVDAEISGKVKVKPGYDGTSVPLRSVCSTSPEGDTSCHQEGNGAKICGTVGSGLIGFGLNACTNHPATVTVTCEGPIKPSPATETVVIEITKKPSSGGGW